MDDPALAFLFAWWQGLVEDGNTELSFRDWLAQSGISHDTTGLNPKSLDALSTRTDDDGDIPNPPVASPVVQLTEADFARPRVATTRGDHVDTDIRPRNGLVRRRQAGAKHPGLFFLPI